MENEDKRSDTFSYTYSAVEQKEVERIRQKYAPAEADKMEQLRALDRSVTQKGTTVALMLGIFGCLLLGIGMCCAMLWSANLAVFVLGIAVGTVGIALIVAAYPLYSAITKKERERIAPEILRLTDELLKK